MENFITFFETMPSWQKLAWIFLCLGIAWLVEAGVPLFRTEYKKWKHLGTNMLFLTSDILINVIVGLLAAGLFVWLANAEFGVLNWLDLPFWANLLISVAVLDFMAQYVVHRLLHKVPIMWRFHMIHHSDTHVDATTGTRHHPGDYIFREIFAMIAVVLFGIPFWAYAFYRILSVLCTYFTHANISLPKWLDRALSFVIVTPNMHKFHHHFERPWTDTNFGNIFSIWDRLFGTLVYEDPKNIVYGLDVVDNSRSNDVLYQLGIPFNSDIKTDKSK